MNEQKRIFTSESVTEGHPDKICDQISDGVLDAILLEDTDSCPSLDKHTCRRQYKQRSADV